MTLIKYENLKNNPTYYIAKNNDEQCMFFNFGVNLKNICKLIVWWKVKDLNLIFLFNYIILNNSKNYMRYCLTMATEGARPMNLSETADKDDTNDWALFIGIKI
jgi:hypothetical protein